ncbi:endonuclease/exonuclease/phosphatase family protein [Heyndrickxia oleronia]|uniref:endonuclease/exonuclease/phosphatase family protein n=1 Tax=Heyndrickxia oleronia TaxID=38875 RepID=UPI0015D1B84E|nr:endonuclease/exonuclease/phosphatase family protein [Bacillus sp. Gen3]
MKIRDKFRLSFLTWNLYMGAELPPLFTAVRNQIPNLVSDVYRQFLATNYPLRVKAIVREIAQKKPDLIGLQEAVKWQLEIPNFRTITYDFVQMLIIELKKKGLDYALVVQNNNTTVELPDSNGNLIRLMDRDAILIRNQNRLQVNKRMKANFQTNLNIQIQNQQMEILRGWCSIDIRLDRKQFRLINTHLDTQIDIQIQQAREIIVGPAQTDLPLIVMGDLNSNAMTNDSITYKQFSEFGMQDIWINSGIDTGVTCCQGPDLLNAESSLDRRIDFILYKNGWTPIEAEIVEGRTNTGLWSSDHAGVSAKMYLN